MTPPNKHLARFEQLLSELFSELGDFRQIVRPTEVDGGSDVTIVSDASGRSYHFQVKFRERITPQIADDLFSRIQGELLPPQQICVVYAPVISPRVAEIARQYDISYVDYAGNCRIVDSSSGLLISRSGLRNEMSRKKQQAVDPFSPKSSRIVRAMLHEARRGWKVGELADHRDVRVSKALVSKVKKALVRESYAVVRDRLLFLKQPNDVLKAWSKAYPGPSGSHAFYVRGDTQEIESKVSAWCERSNIEHALARFSAAWRLAPEVRYSVASLYVSSEAFQQHNLDSLREECGARPVESGENLMLLTPFDQSVFVRRTVAPERATSPLQTFLDLQSMAGRGSEAADTVFDKHLRAALESVDDEKGIT